jgi:predicted metal-dependent phosphoesterase TrpH
MAEIDLHLHTTQSDGRLTPTELITLVADRGLKVVAVTDHDITDGLEPAMAAAAAYPQLTIIPGVELSTDIPGNEVHILGYYIRYEDTAFQATLARFRDMRVGRAQEMVTRLAEMGMPLDWERVREIAGEGAIGRPHIAQALIERGYVSGRQEAFDKYLDRNGPAYAERDKITPEEAVRLVASVGGVPVMAHPGYTDDLENVLKGLVAAGLKGMEVHYAQYDEKARAELAEVAERHGLIPCGGTDYHATGVEGEHQPGEMGPPMETVERLKALAGINAGA